MFLFACWSWRPSRSRGWAYTLLAVTRSLVLVEDTRRPRGRRPGLVQSPECRLLLLARGTGRSDTDLVRRADPTLPRAIRYYARASELLVDGARAEAGPCYVLEGRAALGYAAWHLQRLLAGWVTPKRAVAPLARQRGVLTPATVEEVRQRVEALPPLPADWQPADPGQRERLQKLRRQ